MNLENISASSQGSERPKLGISSCLLGYEVRFDSGHKAHKYIKNTLSLCFDFVPVCPEVSIGMSIPRPPIRLVEREQGDTKQIHLLDSKDYSLDYTTQMQDFSEAYTASSIDELSGYILKKSSPSCGMARVKVYNEKTGHPRMEPSSGLFAEALMRNHPELPVEEEGRLNDLDLRENFLMRVYVYHAWKKLLEEGINAAKLVAFHSRQKYLLMAHDQEQARLIGQLVSKAGVGDINEKAQAYIRLLMQILRCRVSRKRHTNTLMHLMGYLREPLDKLDRKELLDHIMAYYEGKIPLLVPLTLLKHHFNRHPDPYIDIQTYLSPYPVVLNPAQ